MKSLNDVIKALEECMADDAIESEGVYLATDALHYLKEYREKLNILEVRMAEYKRGFEQLGAEWSRIKENPPLTWDELREMEGKPVWVEDNLDVPEDIAKYWAVVKRFEKAECLEYVVMDDFYYEKRGHGKVWQAYRKER